MASDEYDSVEELLIQEAAVDALQTINAMSAVAAVTKTIISGNRLFTLRLMVHDTASKEPSNEIA